MLQTSVSSVLLVYSDRPAVVSYKGGRVFVAMHDAEYLRLKSEWRRKLREVHTDTGGTSTRHSQRLIRRYKAWEAREVAWYAALDLEPPKATDHSVAAVDVLASARGSVGRTRARVLAYRTEHPDAPLSELAGALGLTLGAARLSLLRVTRCPLKQTAPLKMAELLADGRPHSAKQSADALGLSVRQVRRGVSRLRERGYLIRTEYYGADSMYRLLAVPQKVAS